MKILVVVESPAKSKTINKYLGKDYEVKASKGHTVDLPKSDIGVDFEHDFKPTYVVTNSKSLQELKRAYKTADGLIIATDLDREGEAIGWHVADRLGALKDKKSLQRIVFSEITKSAIEKSISNPRNIDMNLVNAQEARRILDRIVGYKLSPLLWKKIMFGLSAGRVQSVALRLIVDREIEREQFKSDEYWSIVLFLDDDKHGQPKIIVELKSKDGEEVEKAKSPDGVEFQLAKISGKTPKIDSEKEAKSLIEDIKDLKLIISSVETKGIGKNPKPPFITSTLQGTAANWFGYSAKQTMRTAQKLYEAGHITYMRTDSTNMAESAIAQARSFVTKKFGKDYIPEKPVFYKTKSKSAQEAHEAIRPTDFTKTADDLGLVSEEAKIYTLISQRALASQMSPAELSQQKIEIASGKYLFTSTAQHIKFKGYLAVYPEKVKEDKIPTLEKGQELFANAIRGKQHFTEPPARYTEASLIKKLEAEGVGRPSTYASIISTILSRKYVEKLNGAFIPTDIGRVVIKLLVDHFPDIVDTKFTSEMEGELDDVADGKLDWKKMLHKFYGPFSKNLQNQEENIKRADYKVLAEAPKGVKCPECKKSMQVKLGRFGKFYSCSNFPDCKGMRSMDGKTDDDVQKESTNKDFIAMYENAPKTDDGRDYILKAGRFGKFWAHPDYPKVKDAQPLKIRPDKLEEVYGEVPKTDDGRPYNLKSGKFGQFWAHPDYPKVKDIQKLQKKPQVEKVEEVAAPAEEGVEEL